jgi:crotonobetainyl-CoA:carnitine CoA-transferase CaiB-like acyl-CoA transferase
MADEDYVKAYGAYRVLDLADSKGFYAGMLLGSLGADVIKIEKPGGDASRREGPFYKDDPDPAKSLFWLGYNANKRGITLDLETADGRALFLKLVKTADVVLESFQPGYLESLGLGYQDLSAINPGLVMTRVTAFGQDGPYANYQASDLICWAISGMLFITGDNDRDPVRVSGIPLTYLLASMDAAWATAIALYARADTGQGQQVDLSIMESGNKTAFMIRERWALTGLEFERGSSYYLVPNSEVKLRLVWEAKDGYVMYMIYTGDFGVDECQRLVAWADEHGMTDEYLKSIDWATYEWRSQTREEADRVQEYFVKFFRTMTKAELLEQALARRIMIQPVSSPKDILDHVQLKAREYWQEIEYPELGTSFKYPERVSLNSVTPCYNWRKAPAIGEHNDEIYRTELGYSAEDLSRFKEAGVI